MMLKVFTASMALALVLVGCDNHNSGKAFNRNSLEFPLEQRNSSFRADGEADNREYIQSPGNAFSTGNSENESSDNSLSGAQIGNSGGGMVVGGSLNGTLLPGRDGGMVVGGPLNGTLLPGSEGGMVVGGPLNGTLLPGE